MVHTGRVTAKKVGKRNMKEGQRQGGGRGRGKAEGRGRDEGKIIIYPSRIKSPSSKLLLDSLIALLISENIS
jgi:hypothetical protein